jgi:hypothetical protein
MLLIGSPAAVKQQGVKKVAIYAELSIGISIQSKIYKVR